MNRMWTFATGFGVGLGLMYLMDPERGTRRRSLVRDKGVRLTHDLQEFLGKAGRDLRNRARGVLAERTRFAQGQPTDDVLAERVRAKLGRFVSHPHAIEVEAHDGAVTLRGPVLAREVPDLIRAVRAIRGVLWVEDRLEPHTAAENVPALQGGSPPPGEPSEWEQRNWTPALRLATVMAGLAMLAVAVRRARSHEGRIEDLSPDLSFHG